MVEKAWRNGGKALKQGSISRGIWQHRTVLPKGYKSARLPPTVRWPCLLSQEDTGLASTLRMLLTQGCVHSGLCIPQLLPGPIYLEEGCEDHSPSVAELKGGQ